jgi:hypothetical protein
LANFDPKQNNLGKESLVMKGIFEFAGGSVPGRKHRRVLRNNQDAFCILTRPDLSIAIVTDGCGDITSLHSEVGAKLGAQLISTTILAYAQRIPVQESSSPSFFKESFFWDRIREDVLAQLRILALNLADSLTEVVVNYLLFSVIGTLITPEESVFFTLGDGIIYVNGELIQIGPFPGNEPPYLGYALLDPSQIGSDSSLFRFQLQRVIPTQELESFLVGSDGVSYLIDAAEQTIPGKEEKIGSVSQFWEDDGYFLNPFKIGRRLSVINRETRQTDWQNKKVVTFQGPLDDDTTLIVGRRIKTEEENENGE